LADLPLTDIFQIVSLSKRTGVLLLSSSGDSASVTFLDGNVIQASTSKSRPTLRERLKNKGYVTEREETVLLEYSKRSGESFFNTAIRRGVVPEEKIEKIFREHIQAAIVDLLDWDEGHFEFHLLGSTEDLRRYNHSEWVLKEGLPTQQLIMDGLRLLDEERHRRKTEENKKKNTIGFATLMDGTPISLSEPELSHPQDTTGHPDGLWESIQEEINGQNVPESDGSGPSGTESPPEAKEEETDFLEELIREVEDDFEPLRQEGKVTEIASLKSMVEELNGPASLSEILLMILRFASDFFSRSILFVVREGEIRGFGQFGLNDNDQSANDRIREMALPANEASILSSAIHHRNRVLGRLDPEKKWDRYILRNLGGEPPSKAVVIPLMNNGHPIALLYGDRGLFGETIMDIEALEIFMIQAGIALDRFLLEQKVHDLQGN